MKLLATIFKYFFLNTFYLGRENGGVKGVAYPEHEEAESALKIQVDVFYFNSTSKDYVSMYKIEYRAEKVAQHILALTASSENLSSSLGLTMWKEKSDS